MWPMSKRRTQEEEVLSSWKRATPVKVRIRRDPTSVLSIRVSQRTLKALSERGAAEEKTAGEYARDLIERGLDARGDGTPAELGRMFSRWLTEYERRHRARKSRRGA
jgi:hypothetical protein